MSRPLSLTTDPIPQLTWRIALPMSIGMFFNTLFNVVDTYYAGWLGTESLAALSLSFPLFFALFAVGSGISQGATALLANALGKNDEQEARETFIQAFLFLIVIATGLSVIGLLVSRTVFIFLGAEDSYLQTALSYMSILFAGGIFLLLPMVLNSALSAEGRTEYYRNTLVAGFIANLILNPLFIMGWFGFPKMGVGGIALATVIIQAGACYYLWHQVRKSPIYLNIRREEFSPNWKVLRRIAGQGVPAALNMLTIAIGIFVTTWFVKNFGKEAVAATGISTRIEQIILLPAIGLNAAVLSIVGQNHGAGLSHRVREAWVANIRYGIILMLLGGIVLWLVREPAMRIFTKDPEVITHGKNYLLSASLTLAAYPILFVTTFALQGIKRPAYGLCIGLYRQLLAPAIVFHLLAFKFGWGLWGIWWGVCFVTWSAALFSLVYGYLKISRT